MQNDMIKVLDHGHVRLVDSMGNDLSISRNARVSYDAEWRAGEDEKSDIKLIRYLYKNGHNTPFEAVTVTFDVKAPIFVFRQWHRHRTQSYNELSARYKPLPNEFYVPEIDKITMQATDNKQMRTDEQNPYADVIQGMIQQENNSSYQTYERLLAMGCPRELARSVLPVGMYSHMFATASLHNWFKFLALRIHPHAQYEIRVYGEAILKLLEPIAPVAVAAFKEFTLKDASA
jgi:thymidylate synthase (FAD)